MRERLLGTFEGFTKDNLDYLVKNKKTYVRKHYREGGVPIKDIQRRIKDYDITLFRFEVKSYGTFIYPDVEFIRLIKELDGTVDDSMFFYITVSGDMNYVDFSEGVPPYLRGLSVSYKIYRRLIRMNDFICSDRYSTLSAWNLWYNLLQDEELYALTSPVRSCLIDKKVSDERIREIIGVVTSGVETFEVSDDLKERLGE